MIRAAFMKTGLFLAGLLALAAPARAQSVERLSTGITDTLQSAIDLLPPGVNNVRIGAGPAFYPDFEGSKDYTAHVVPVVSLKYEDLIEVINNEIKVTAFNHLFAPEANTTKRGGSLRVGPLISLNFGRGEKDSPALRGLGDVGTSLELGAFIAYMFEDNRLRARLRQDVAGGHKGATLQLDYSRTFLRGPRISLSASVGLDMASAPYMKSFFGVDAGQSLRSGLPAYRPGGGFKDANAGINGSYAVADHWTIFATAGAERLIGVAGDSPLIRLRGSKTNATFSTFLVYAF